MLRKLNPSRRGRRRRRAVLVSIAIAALSHLACARSTPSVPFGFGQDSGRAELTLEARFLDLPDPTRIRDAHRLLTSRPHPAGTPRDRELADWTAEQFRSAGLDDVQIATHEVLLQE